jgi:arginyl-tRNA synthetase
VIPGDIGAELARVLQAMVTAGELPSRAASLSAAGTWRPAPAEAGGGPGTYATSLPLALARLAGRAGEPVAEALAAGLAAVPWIGSAQMTGGGYLTVTVTAAHLAGLPARIAGAGPGVATSGALAGTSLTAPRQPDPAAAADWEQAWRAQRDALAGRLAEAAGAEVSFFDAQREPTRAPATQARAGSAPVTTADTGADPVARAGRGPVAAAVAWHGAEAVRYALARTSAPRAGAISRQLGLPLDLTNPFVAVRYAHADAASVLRWAGDLSAALVKPEARPGRAPDLAPPELALVDAMSWLPERVAAAARRRRPAELAGYLENLAAAWLDCADSCPALPFRGHGGPAVLGGEQTAARLELSQAARIVLDAGLVLLGMSAPARM